jgi:hypothetical protein
MPVPVTTVQKSSNLCYDSLIHTKVSCSATFDRPTSLTTSQQFCIFAELFFSYEPDVMSRYLENLRRQFSSWLYPEQEEEIPERMPMQVLPVGGIYTAIEEEKRRKLEEARRKELEERAKKEGGCPTCCQKVR